MERREGQAQKTMDAAHFEKMLTSEVLFEGRVITLTKDTALLENGETAQREVVHHHGGACIVPYFEDGDRKSTRLNSSHPSSSRMPSSA